MSSDFKIEARELIAEVDGLRTSILTIGPGQCDPWHHHSIVTDTFFCIEGPMQIALRNPEEQRVLAPGETTAVQSLRPHRVSGIEGGRCKFLIIQGVGHYDFVPC